MRCQRNIFCLEEGQRKRLLCVWLRFGLRTRTQFPFVLFPHSSAWVERSLKLASIMYFLTNVVTFDYYLYDMSRETRSDGQLFLYDTHLYLISSSHSVEIFVQKVMKSLLTWWWEWKGCSRDQARVKKLNRFTIFITTYLWSRLDYLTSCKRLSELTTTSLIFIKVSAFIFTWLSL